MKSLRLITFVFLFVLCLTARVRADDFLVRQGQWRVEEVDRLPPQTHPAEREIVAGTDGKRNARFVFGNPDSWEIDLKTNQRRKLPPCPCPIPAGCAAVVSGAQSVLLVGGGADVLVYQTVLRSWTRLRYPMPVPVKNADVSFSDGLLKVVGGADLKTGRVCNRIQTADFNVPRYFGWTNSAVLVLYAISMLGVGVFFMRRGRRNSEDYFKGGGRIPWWVNGFSIYATMLSSITFTAVPAMTYISDLRYYPGSLMILVMAVVVIHFYIPFFRSLNLTSAYEYLEARFSLGVRLFASAAYILFMICRSMIVIYLPALMLYAVAGVNMYLSILLVGLVTVTYSTIGGIEGVVWSDFLQALILVGGAVLAFCWLIHGAGGFETAYTVARDAGKLRLVDASFDWSRPTLWVVILGGIAQNLSQYTSDQTVVQRYLTTKTSEGAIRSMWLNGLLSVTILVLFYLLGTALFTFYRANPSQFDVTLHSNDAIFPTFMITQLPRGVAGLLIAAVFSATMSTLSSCFNSTGAIVVSDFAKRFFAPTEKQAWCTACVSTAVTGLFATLLALLLAATPDIKCVFDISYQVIGLFIGGLGGLFFAGIFLPRVSAKAVGLGLVAAYGTNLILAYGDVVGLHFVHKPHVLLYGAIGLAVSVGSSLLFSWVFPETDRRKIVGLTYKQSSRGKTC